MKIDVRGHMKKVDEPDKASGKNLRCLAHYVLSNYSSILDPQVQQDKTSVTVAPTAPGPTTTSRLEQLRDLQVVLKPPFPLSSVQDLDV